jgi:ketosteroid isomerase-like protein
MLRALAEKRCSIAMTGRSIAADAARRVSRLYWSRVRGTWLLVALAGAAPGLLAADVPAPLAETLSRVSGAFQAEDARAVRKSCSSRTRVRVDLGSLSGGAASYAGSQLQVVMDGIFARRHTESFDVPDSDVRMDGDTAYAQGRWTHRAEDGDADLRKDTLTLVLRREDEGWRVVEMRAGR